MCELLINIFTNIFHEQDPPVHPLRLSRSLLGIYRVGFCFAIPVLSWLEDRRAMTPTSPMLRVAKQGL